MAHAGERLELERAFSGATVHDMFNMFLRSTVGIFFWASLGVEIRASFFWFVVRSFWSRWFFHITGLRRG